MILMVALICANLLAVESVTYCAADGCTYGSLGCTYISETYTLDCNAQDIGGPVHVTNYPEDVQYIQYNRDRNKPDASEKLNSITSLSANEFDGCPLLKVVDLNRNQLTSISSTLFKKNPALTYINLYYNKLTVLAGGQFSTNILLTDIDLSGNTITSLASDQFAMNPKLEKLYFSNNLLVSIPMFTFNPELITADFSHNKLEAIPVGTFVNNSKLETLNLADTLSDLRIDRDLHCRYFNAGVLPSSGVIEDLDLSNNKMIFHPNAFQGINAKVKLQYINDVYSYRHNLIIDVSSTYLGMKPNANYPDCFGLLTRDEDLFKHLPTLTTLKAEMCKLGEFEYGDTRYVGADMFRKYGRIAGKTAIQSGIFKGITNLEALHIGGNAIKYAPDDTFLYNSKMSSITLKFATTASTYQNLFLSPITCPALNYRTLVSVIDTHFYACNECLRPENVPEPLTFSCWHSIDEIFSHHPPTMCPKGSWCNSTTLSEYKCKKGTYNAIEGRGNPSSCKSCPKESFNTHEGQASCPYKCSGRKKKEKNSLTDPCEDCLPGTFAINVFTCHLCPLGFYQDETHATNCKVCSSANATSACEILPGTASLTPTKVSTSLFPFEQIKTATSHSILTEVETYEQITNNTKPEPGAAKELYLLPANTALILNGILAFISLSVIVAHRAVCKKRYDVLFGDAQPIQAGHAQRSIPTKLGASFTFFAICVLLELVILSFTESQETTTTGLLAHNKQLFDQMKVAVREDNTYTEEDFGSVSVTTIFFGPAHAKDLCLTNFGAREVTKFSAKTNSCMDKPTMKIMDNGMGACTIAWKCRPSLDVHGTVSLNIPNIPNQFQSFSWTISAESRTNRSSGFRYRTSVSGVVAPMNGTELCGTGIKPTLLTIPTTRGFATVNDLRVPSILFNYATAGLQLGSTSTKRQHCVLGANNDGIDDKSEFHQVRIDFVFSELLEIETTLIHSWVGRMSQVAALFMTGLGFLKMAKSKLQKQVDANYLKYPKKYVPTDVLKRQRILGEKGKRSDSNSQSTWNSQKFKELELTQMFDGENNSNNLNPLNGHEEEIKTHAKLSSSKQVAMLYKKMLVMEEKLKDVDWLRKRLSRLEKKSGTVNYKGVEHKKKNKEEKNDEEKMMELYRWKIVNGKREFCKVLVPSRVLEEK